jgi:C1A family cysteine protease
MPNDGEFPSGAHALDFVDYDDDYIFPGGLGYPNGAVFFRNSWGQGWGNNGYGSLPYAYVDAYAFDLFQIQIVQ